MLHKVYIAVDTPCFGLESAATQPTDERFHRFAARSINLFAHKLLDIANFHRGSVLLPLDVAGSVLLLVNRYFEGLVDKTFLGSVEVFVNSHALPLSNPVFSEWDEGRTCSKCS